MTRNVPTALKHLRVGLLLLLHFGLHDLCGYVYSKKGRLTAPTLCALNPALQGLLPHALVLIKKMPRGLLRVSGWDVLR